MRSTQLNYDFLANTICLLYINHVTVFIWISLITLSFGEQEVGLNPLSTYPYMSDYKTELYDHQTKCKYFMCEKSGLYHAYIQILVNKMNGRLLLYAKDRETANTYQLFWDHDIALYAKRKAKLCLPPTVTRNGTDYVLYDTQGFYEFMNSNNPMLQKTIALEVAIGTRETAISNRELAVFVAEMPEYYTSLFFTEKLMERRGGTTVVGCSYIVEETSTIFRDHLLCIFGYLYFGAYAYFTRHGNPCTECDYYDNINVFPAPYATLNKTPFWACDMRYPTLCTDLRKELDVEDRDYNFNCDEKHLVFFPPEIQKEKIVDKTDSGNSQPWPCWYILAPLLMIIVIVLIISIYHFVTAFMTKFRTRK